MRYFNAENKMKGDFFHILNRGVEKRKIFLSENDYIRFIYNLYDFNDIKNVVFDYPQRKKDKEFWDVGRPNSRVGNKRKKEEIVDIFCWTLMSNHPHIFIQDKIDTGSSLFSKKIIGGYTKYFNEKNKREGVLFQGKSKIIKVEQEPHFYHLPYYIMANPIELVEPNWKENGIKDIKKVIEFLGNYKYSSFPDLIGKENFPFVVNKKLFYELFNTNEEKFRKDFTDWLGDYEVAKEEFDFRKHEI